LVSAGVRMGKRLYVGNLPYQCDEAQLRALFEQEGRQVEEVKIVTDRETGRPRGFAFVELATDAQAQAAVSALNGKPFGGRPLTVSEARERAPGGGGAARAAAPPVVSWQEAGGHVGEVVSVEGEVATARTVGDTWILEFARDDPRAFRVVVLLPLLETAPRLPERLYQGRRVRATGRVQRFQGRAEMVLRGSGQIEVVETGGEAPPAAPAPTP